MLGSWHGPVAERRADRHLPVCLRRLAQQGLLRLWLLPCHALGIAWPDM